MTKEQIRVLYYTDPTAFQIFGGGEIHMLKTKEYLEKGNRNTSLKFFDTFKDRLDDYDILHIFHMRPDCLSICRLAKKRGLRVVLTPIYSSGAKDVPETWKYESVLVKMMSKARIFYVNLNNYGFATFRTLYPFRDFLELADVVLPNSRMEAVDLSREFKVDLKKFFPIHLGVERKFANVKPDLFVKKYGLKDFVLYVGRIDPGKNVFKLLEACGNIDVPLVIIGGYNYWEPEYFEKCKKYAEGKKNIHFLGSFPSESEELVSAYAAAKVFVLPSWLEIPGLSALEAGLAGCNVVITSRGSTTEYFKNYATYVNPASKEDIRKKVLDAFERPRTDNLRHFILNNYTWEKTATKTLDAYASALRQQSRNNPRRFNHS